MNPWRPNALNSVIGVIFLMGMLIGSAIKAQEVAKKTIFDAMSFDEPLDIELVTDLKLLVDQKNTNEYQPAKISYKDAAGKVQTWEVKIRSRGKFRRKICVFPPLKLNFSKKELLEKGLAKDDEMKLVTHCIDGLDGKEYLLRELLAYKLYEIISNYHFRTHLVSVKYRDSNDGTKINNMGILMEDEKTMANRYNAKICDNCFSPSKDSLNVSEVNKMALFEYMICNTDWSIPMVRNLKMLNFKDQASKKILVPYDFDFSGLVNASYAVPSTDLRQLSVRDRVFLGLPGTDADLKETIAFFKSKKKELLGCIRTFKRLSPETKDDIYQYINSFFDALDAGDPIKRP